MCCSHLATWTGPRPGTDVTNAGVCFGSRLLPVIRNFVAVPAGVARVPALRFGVLTAFGSLIWVSAMAGIGYTIGNQWKTVMNRFSDAGYLLGALALVIIVFLVWHRWRSYQADTSSA